MTDTRFPEHPLVWSESVSYEDRWPNDRTSGVLAQGQPADQFTPKQGATTLSMSSLADCDKMLTLDCARAWYKIPKGSPAKANNPLGAVEYTPQAFLQRDLDRFFAKFEPGLVGKGPDVKTRRQRNHADPKSKRQLQ